MGECSNRLECHRQPEITRNVGRGTGGKTETGKSKNPEAIPPFESPQSQQPRWTSRKFRWMSYREDFTVCRLPSTTSEQKPRVICPRHHQSAQEAGEHTGGPQGRYYSSHHGHEIVKISIYRTRKAGKLLNFTTDGDHLLGTKFSLR